MHFYSIIIYYYCYSRPDLYLVISYNCNNNSMHNKSNNNNIGHTSSYLHYYYLPLVVVLLYSYHTRYDEKDRLLLFFATVLYCVALLALRLAPLLDSVSM